MSVSTRVPHHSPKTRHRLASPTARGTHRTNIGTSTKPSRLITNRSQINAEQTTAGSTPGERCPFPRVQITKRDAGSRQTFRSVIEIRGKRHFSHIVRVFCLFVCLFVCTRFGAAAFTVDAPVNQRREASCVSRRHKSWSHAGAGTQTGERAGESCQLQ